jgi:hypothetical protein
MVVSQAVLVVSKAVLVVDSQAAFIQVDSQVVSLVVD